MVDRVLNWGEAGSVSDLSDTECTIKTTTRKRKPDVSPNIRNKLKRFEKEKSTDSPVKSFLRQFQYECEEGETNMTRSGDKSKEPPNDGKDEKGLEERIREDQDKFMKEIRETLSTNITNSTDWC